MALNTGVSCRKCSLTLIFLLLCLYSFGQYNFGEVDKKIAASQKELGKNIVVLIYKGGKIIYKKESEDLKANMQEPIANCSSWLTAALVMTFVDQGKLSLDDKVGQFLPLFNTYGKKYITIRNCLNNTAGIQAGKGLLDHGHYKTLEDEVNDYASKHEIETNPGEEFRYNEIGINIAGRVLELVGKRSFEQLMNERILRPLNMHNSTFFSEHAMDPFGGGISAASDYMNFLSMILNKGVFNGKQILSEKAITAMLQPQVTPDKIKLATPETVGFNYGLGEWIQDTDDKGNATVVSSPGILGTWPLVDLCRGYACIFFLKGALTEQKKKIYESIKNTIDEIIPSTCK